MTSYRHLVAFLLLSVVLTYPAIAQTTEVAIAPDYALVAGRLSVTFTDTTSESRAKVILADQGYEVLQTTFEPVMVPGYVNDKLTEEQLADLRAHPDVITLNHIDGAELQRKSLELLKKNNPNASPDIDDQFSKMPASPLIFRISPSLTEDQATTLVQTLVPGITISQVQKTPNEIIIGVGEGQEDAAIKRLDALPDVRYVAYINAY